MQWLTPPPAAAGWLALLPAAWNPPTCAHLALARAALDQAASVAFVLPRVFPHKLQEGAAPRLRERWLVALAHAEPGCCAAVSDGGLFIEMAREARESIPDSRVALVCGSDAADRIVNWRYAPPDSIDHQLEEYELWVAARGHAYSAPAHLASRFRSLDVGEDFHLVSSSEVRQRIAARGAWHELVPEPIRDSVARAYS